MKANEFVKQYGWDEAESKVDEGLFLSTESFEFLGHVVNVDELSSLIRSHKIVQSFGGLQDAITVSKMGGHYKYLKKAIADVESCQ